MKESKRNGPMDLMLDGKFAEAAEIYLDMYTKLCLVRRDRFIGPYVLTPLHTCVARIKVGQTFDEVSKNLESMIWERARERGVEVDRELEMDVSDDIAVAREHIRATHEMYHEDDWI